jgi:hypothetical protein
MSAFAGEGKITSNIYILGKLRRRVNQKPAFRGDFRAIRQRFCKLLEVGKDVAQGQPRWSPPLLRCAQSSHTSSTRVYSRHY